MIEVIKHGKKKFTATCTNCGCEFTYELSDVIGGYVSCPDCGRSVAHLNFGNNNGSLYYPPNCRGIQYPLDTRGFTVTGTESKPEDNISELTTTNTNKSIVVGDLHSPQGDTLKPHMPLAEQAPKTCTLNFDNTSVRTRFNSITQ